MARFEEVHRRRIDDDEESFLDWEGEATLFSEDEEDVDEEAVLEEEEDELDEEEDVLDVEEDDEEVDELDFG